MLVGSVDYRARVKCSIGHKIWWWVGKLNTRINGVYNSETNSWILYYEQNVYMI